MFNNLTKVHRHINGFINLTNILPITQSNYNSTYLSRDFYNIFSKGHKSLRQNYRKHRRGTIHYIINY
jgi:hypothetical protein